MQKHQTGHTGSGGFRLNVTDSIGGRAAHSGGTCSDTTGLLGGARGNQHQIC